MYLHVCYYVTAESSDGDIKGTGCYECSHYTVAMATVLVGFWNGSDIRLW